MFEVCFCEAVQRQIRGARHPIMYTFDYGNVMRTGWTVRDLFILDLCSTDFVSKKWSARVTGHRFWRVEGELGDTRGHSFPFSTFISTISTFGEMTKN